MKEIIRTQNLSKRYGESPVVKGIDLSVPEGTIYGFCGPNGAGKSTTLKMLLGLVRPTEGEISIFGREMTAKNRIEILRQTGSLIESPSYYGHLTGKENLEILQGLLKAPKENVEKVLRIVRLHDQGKKKVSAYSLGMKQRLGLASALLNFPKLLILDEPTNGLDPAGIQEMRELVRSLPGKYGITVVISSHLLSEIDQIVDDIGIIAGGKLKYQGSLERLHEYDRAKTLEEIFLDMTTEEVSL
ncbi:MAG: ABC transporter ATP-binding protein [Lachnospiraceae bacterium]|nr:ABC transporter ATP-binding protein [Lachnospiraceae bacterium]